MMRRVKGTKKLNNKGFSLVEVIAAVIILGVVAVPILSCFTSSARYNTKAKRMQRMTSAAQSLMEGFKADTVANLKKQFSGSMPVRVYNAGAIDNVSLNTIPNPGGSEVLEFGVKGMDYRGVKFDAKVTVSDFVSPSGYDGNTTLRKMENINAFQDAIYCESEYELSSMHTVILTQAIGDVNNAEKVLPDYTVHTFDKSKLTVDRDIKVEISGNATNQVVKVTTTYKGTIKDYPYKDSAGNNQLFNETFSYPVVTTIFDNADTYASDGVVLKNVFIFVYPGYSASATDYPIKNETISFTSSMSDFVDVYFAKQKNSTITDLLTCETTYSPSVSCSGPINLYHNFKDNLANGTKFTSSFVVPTLGATIEDGLSFDKDQVLLFSLVVDMYEEGAFDVGFAGLTPIYTLNGTMNDY